MLPTQIGRRLAGLWLLATPDGAPECRGIEVRPNESGRGFGARLIFWSPGRLGCTTRSSDIVRVELDAHASDDGRLVFQGAVPRMHEQDEPVELVVDLSGTDRHSASLRHRGVTRDVALTYSELEPAEDLVRE